MSSWFPAPRLTGACLLLAMAVAWPGPAQALQDDEYLGLPGAPGREEVVAYCAACHSLKLVVQQGLDRERWDELLVWMVKEHGMPELDPSDRKLVLDYLAEHVGPEDQKERLKQHGLRP